MIIKKSRKKFLHIEYIFCFLLFIFQHVQENLSKVNPIWPKRISQKFSQNLFWPVCRYRLLNCYKELVHIFCSFCCLTFQNVQKVSYLVSMDYNVTCWSMKTVTFDEADELCQSKDAYLTELIEAQEQKAVWEYFRAYFRGSVFYIYTIYFKRCNCYSIDSKRRRN